MTTAESTPRTAAPVPGAARSADGTTIAYETSGTGPVLVVVEGATGYRASGGGRSHARHLAADLTVVAYDRRGRGESGDTAPYAVEREVEDLAALLDAVGGRAALHGTSSGACLAVQAAAAGLPVTAVSLFEPPVRLGAPDPADQELAARIARLAGEGRRGEAVEAFQLSIGVPPEVVAAFASARGPAEAVAHTIPYDLAVCAATTPDVVARVGVPALVLDSSGSSADLTGWAAAVVGALPRAEHRSFDAQWHSVPDAELAPVVRDFVLRAG